MSEPKKRLKLSVKSPVSIAKAGGIAAVLLSMLVPGRVPAQTAESSWPVLKHYNQNHLLNVALPLGGIGTGTVSLDGRGELRDWQIMNRHNFMEPIPSMRSYVMDRESGLIMASWPKGRLKVPFPYFAESMSGFEYTAAVGMLQEGQTDAGLKCIKAIRDRFDGEKRNPFDEPECGHHYAKYPGRLVEIIRSNPSLYGVLLFNLFLPCGTEQDRMD